MKYSPVNLSYLTTLCDGDEAFMQEIIRSFVEDMPLTLQEIQQRAQQQDWTCVGELAHKIKPSMQFVGMPHTQQKVKTIEQFSKKNIYLEEIPTLLAAVVLEIEEAVLVLQEKLDTDVVLRDVCQS